MKVIYTGFFIDKKELDRILLEQGLTQRLEKPIETPHVTLAFMPDDIHEELLGTHAQIEAYAYGNDGRNEGLEVRVETEEPLLADMAASLPHPHITLSLAEGASAVDTGRLEFTEIAPFLCKGVFGAFVSYDEDRCRLIKGESKGDKQADD